MELTRLIELVHKDLDRLQTIGHVSNKVRLELIESRKKQLKYLWKIYKNELKRSEKA